LIAFYLPQFHPIPENDLWWGNGFTEWTNVAKARPLFRGHYQPHVPADLGFYDLRLPETRAAQTALARAAGIEGFCYWHYWFAGRRILERPFNEVLRLKEPDFPFCLGWANHSWNRGWHGGSNKILIEQTYPGRADYERHFYAILEAFQDPRYIRVCGKPVFVIFSPTDLPRPAEFIELWQALAARNGLAGIHFVAHVLASDQPYDYRSHCFDATIAMDALEVSNMNIWRRSLTYYQLQNGHGGLLKSVFQKPRALTRALYLKGQKHLRPLLSRPKVFEYSEAMLHCFDHVTPEVHCYPNVVPNWDDSPRRGTRGFVVHNSTPELFRKHIRQALRLVADRPFEDRIIFVKSWNEWAEGNYLEPDLRFGHQYLDVVREEVLGPPCQEAAGPPSHMRSSGPVSA
jgi:hypothetical protein